MAPKCPDLNSPDFQDTVDRLGGLRQTPEDIKDPAAYKAKLTPEQQKAYALAHSYWDEHNGDTDAINAHLDSHDMILREIPSGVVRTLKNKNAPKTFIADIIEKVKLAMNPDYSKLDPEWQNVYKNAISDKEISNIKTHIIPPQGKAKQYQQFNQVFTAEQDRVAMRSTLKHALDVIGSKFLLLKDAQSVARIEKVAFRGDVELSERYRDLLKATRQAKSDAESKHFTRLAEELKARNGYSDKELQDGIKMSDGGLVKLNTEEIKAYRSIGEYYKTWWEKNFAATEAMTLAEYSNKPWFQLLQKSFGGDIKELKDVIDPLAKVANAADRKLTINISQIFKNLSEGIKGITKEERSDIHKAYTLLHGNMTTQIDALKKAVARHMNEKDDAKITAMTQELLGAYIATEPGMTEIRKRRQEMGNVIGYVTREREKGKRKLRILEEIKVTDKDGNEKTVEVERFMRMWTTKKEYADLVNYILSRPEYAKNGKLKKGFRREDVASNITPESSYGGVSDVNTMTVINNALEKLKLGGTIDPATWAQMKQPLIDAMSNEISSRGWGERKIRRQRAVVKGYKETGLKEIMNTYGSGLAGMITKQDFSRKYMNIVSDMKGGGDTPILYGDIVKYGKDMLRNDDSRDRASGFVRSFISVMMLGGLIRPLGLNLTQNLTMGAPELAMRMKAMGVKGSGTILLGKAMKDIFAHIIGKGQSKNIDSIENEMLKELYNDATIKDQMTREITGQFESQKGKIWNSIVHYSMKPFSVIESVNRGSAALAMFRLSYAENVKNGLSPGLEGAAFKDAKTKAKDFTDTVHLIYGKSNRPRALSGGEDLAILGATAYTFRTFTHGYATWFLQQADWKARSMSLGYIALFGGLMGLPFIKSLLDEIEKRTGFSPARELKKKLKGVGGDALATGGMNGLPALFGADISGSLELGLPFVGETPADTVYGAVGGLYTKAKTAAELASLGAWWRAGETILPAGVAAPLKAIRLTTQPVTSAKGELYYDDKGQPIRLTASEIALAAGGFQPTRIKTESGEERSAQMVEKYFANKRAHVNATYKVARANNDKNANKDMMEAVKEYNDLRKSRGVTTLINPLTISAVMKSYKTVPTTKERKRERYLRSE